MTKLLAINGYHLPIPIGSMVLPYMVTWIPSIYPSHVSIYTSTMDPMGYETTWMDTFVFFQLKC